jgi:hypothetical protein
VRARSLVLAATVAAVGASSCGDDGGGPAGSLPDPHRTVGFHGDRRKLGWVDAELALDARSVSIAFGRAWESPPFDGVQIADRSYPPLVYASPLFVPDIRTSAGPRALVYVATTSGFVYAVTASANNDPVKPGDFLFRTQVVTPAAIPGFDGGVPLGILSTPIVDVDRVRLYVTAYDATRGWLAFALDAADGTVLPGWPVVLDETTLGPVNTNGPAFWSAVFPPAIEMGQRSALTLSPHGDRLYVAFGSYASTGPGWLAAVDTSAARVDRSFSAAPSREPRGSGGIWGVGGPALDPAGRLWVTTGSSPPGTKETPRTWGNSLVVLDPELRLEASYTPYDYCKLDDGGIDLAASAPLVLPNLNPAQTSTPRLAAFGSEHGTVYLLDRDRLGPLSDRRPPCGTDPAQDRSLLSPTPQPDVNARGPLTVFGPFSDELAAGDFARMRSRPAYFRDGAGEHFLFLSGSYKSAVGSTASVPPGIAKVRVVFAPGQPAWLERTLVNGVVTLIDPGSPIVTGEKDGAVVWVLDDGALGGASPLDASSPPAVLYAFSARDLSLLWKSGDGELGRTGKYGVPAAGNGRIYVATDRLIAFQR